MGTASTMAIIAETLGMMPANSAACPAVDADRLRIAEESGRIAFQLIAKPIRPREVITTESVENALRVLLAIGGSTNAIIHLTAIAGRAGIKVDLKRLNLAQKRRQSVHAPSRSPRCRLVDIGPATS